MGAHPPQNRNIMTDSTPTYYKAVRPDDLKTEAGA